MFCEFFSKTEIVKLRISAVATDAFKFPKEILKRNTSLFPLLAVSEEMRE